LVRQCLPIPQKIYKITKKRLRTPDEIEQYFPAGFLAFIDFTEQQRIPRPVDKRKRKAYYSGKKKKRHTVKTQRGWLTILVLSCIKNNQEERKKRHDYDIYKNNHPVIPKQVVIVVDLGYLGIETDF